MTSCVVKKRLAGAKHARERKGEEIEDGADRLEDEHEMLDKLNVHFNWQGNGFLRAMVVMFSEDFTCSWYAFLWICEHEIFP